MPCSLSTGVKISKKESVFFQWFDEETTHLPRSQIRSLVAALSFYVFFLAIHWKHTHWVTPKKVSTIQESSAVKHFLCYVVLNLGSVLFNPIYHVRCWSSTQTLLLLDPGTLNCKNIPPKENYMKKNSCFNWDSNLGPQKLLIFYVVPNH